MISFQLWPHLSFEGYLLQTESSFAFIHFDLLFENWLQAIVGIITSDHQHTFKVDNCTPYW